MYSGYLEDWYTSLGVQTLAPKKHSASDVFQIYWCGNHWFHNASSYFKIVLRILKSKQKRKTMRHWVQSKRKNCKQKRFHLFNYVIDRTTIPFLFYVNSLNCFKLFLQYYMLHLLSSDRLCNSHRPIAIQMFYLEILIFQKNHRYNHR